MLRPRHAEDRRRAVILMVVLVLLTLFAIVGITFVFYAQKNHSASVNFREALQRNPYAGGPGSPTDIAPYILFRWAVGQLIYDVADDATGTQSALRGHSLARTMYGYNDQVLNLQPYNGTGRLHYTQPATAGVFAGADDYPLVNYTYFKTSDNILRDPERFGPRADLATARGPYAGGANASYTYPDLNTLALSAYRADGRQMMPSFHRPWLFNPNLALNDTTNANWTNAQGKYLILRPRPADHLLAGETGVQQDATGQWVAIPTNRPVFPYPADATGDIKNRIGSPGGNDSIWIGLGCPVTIARTAPSSSRCSPGPSRTSTARSTSTPPAT